MREQQTVTVEFYGVPRQRAGRAELTVAAGRMADVLAQVQQACPRLDELVQPDGRLSSHYLLSLNGEQFATDLREELEPGSRVLLLSADAGG